MTAVGSQTSIEKIMEQDPIRDFVLCQWLREQLQTRYPDVGKIHVNPYKAIRPTGLAAAADSYSNDCGCDFTVTFPDLLARALHAKPLPANLPSDWQYGWFVDAKDSSLERRGRSQYWEPERPQFAAEILSAFDPAVAPYINSVFVKSKAEYTRLMFDIMERNRQPRGQRDPYRTGWLHDPLKITTHLLYIYRKDDMARVGVSGAWLFPSWWLRNAIVRGVGDGWYQDNRRMMLVNNYQPNTSNTKSLVAYAAADDLYQNQSRACQEIKYLHPGMVDNRILQERDALSNYTDDAAGYVSRFQLDPSSYYDRLEINGRQLP